MAWNRFAHPRGAWRFIGPTWRTDPASRCCRRPESRSGFWICTGFRTAAPSGGGWTSRPSFTDSRARYRRAAIRWYFSKPTRRRKTELESNLQECQQTAHRIQRHGLAIQHDLNHSRRERTEHRPVAFAQIVQVDLHRLRRRPQLLSVAAVSLGGPQFRTGAPLAAPPHFHPPPP